MKLIRTACSKLTISPQEKQILLLSLEKFTYAYNFCCSTGFSNNTSNGITLHKLTYNSCREYLPSQLAISARMMATDSLKSLSRKKKGKVSCPYSKRMSIRLDKNSHTIWFNKSLISILTCNGRLKLNLNINPYFKQFLSWKHTSCSLSFKKNNFFLKVQFEKDIQDFPKSENFIGIDRGIKKLACTSDNRFFGGGNTRRICRKYQSIRSKLQKCGTKSAKRHLARLSGQEQRFKADTNHVISKRIIQGLKSGDVIVLEDLSGIRNKRMRKKQRKEINSWNFYQLEQFLKYKAEGKGIYIEYVDARYTSQRCSKCGNIKRSNRKSQSCFECKKCGFKLNADLNAARNIVMKHLDATNSEKNSLGYPERAPVNEPIVTRLTKVNHQVSKIPDGGVASLEAGPLGS
jgi:putative transposase